MTTITDWLNAILLLWRGTEREPELRKEWADTSNTFHRDFGWVNPDEVAINDGEVLTELITIDPAQLSPYLESDVQSMMAEYPPTTIDDLVLLIQAAGGSPGARPVAQLYLESRRKNLRFIDTPPIFEPLFARSYGIPLWQEDVVDALVTKGGFKPDRAWSTLRIMRETKDRTKLADPCMRFAFHTAAEGVTDEEAEEAFDWLRSYGERVGCRASIAMKAACLYMAAGYSLTVPWSTGSETSHA